MKIKLTERENKT